MNRKKTLLSIAIVAVPTAAFAGAMTYWVDMTDSNRPYTQFRMDSAKCDLQKQQVDQIDQIRSDNLSAQCNNHDTSACYGSIGNSLGHIFGKSEGASAYSSCMMAYGWELMSAPDGGNHKIHFIDGPEYEGEFKRGQFDGMGQYTFTNGTTYKGNFVSGNFSGYGVMTRDGRTIYEGNFRNDKFNGQGKRFNSDGSIAEGNFIDGKLNGPCRIDSPSGNHFVGICVDDKRKGKGTITNPKGIIVEGYFRKDGQINGDCKATRPNGDVFTGTCVDNKREGRGTLKFATGVEFTGNYRNGQRNGDGTLKGVDGTILYKGRWQDGCPIDQVDPVLKDKIFAHSTCASANIHND